MAIFAASRQAKLHQRKKHTNKKSQPQKCPFLSQTQCQGPKIPKSFICVACYRSYWLLMVEYGKILNNASQKQDEVTTC